MSNIEKQLEQMKKEIWADVDWKDNYSKALVYLNYYMDENDKLSLENIRLKDEVRRLKDDITGKGHVMADRLQYINDYKALLSSKSEMLAEKDAKIAELKALVAKLEDDADFLAKELDIVDAKALELQRALKGGL